MMGSSTENGNGTIKMPPPAGRRLRAGIVGAGLMGRWHARAIERIGGQVSAVADPADGAARRLASSCRGAQTFSGVEDMLSRSSLDALHICAPPASHYTLANLAIDAGVHAIIEKPFTLTPEEAEHLFDRADERGIILCPVHQFLFQDGVLKAREMLPSLGRVLHMEGVICSAGGGGREGDELDSVVSEILPHQLSLMQMFLPAGVPDQDWLTLRPAHGEFRAINEASGTSLAILISLNARPTTCSFVMVGTGGTFHLDLFHGFSFIEPGAVSKTRKIMHPFDLAIRRFSTATLNISRRALRSEFAYPGLKPLISAFYEAMRTGGRPPISREDTLKVARARDRLIQSAGADCRVGV